MHVLLMRHLIRHLLPVRQALAAGRGRGEVYTPNLCARTFPPTPQLQRLRPLGGSGITQLTPYPLSSHRYGIRVMGHSLGGGITHLTHRPLSSLFPHPLQVRNSRHGTLAGRRHRCAHRVLPGQRPRTAVQAGAGGTGQRHHLWRASCHDR